MGSTKSHSKNSSTNLKQQNPNPKFPKKDSETFLEREYLLDKDEVQNLFENKYKIIRKLGEGSHAKVYLGKRRNSKRRDIMPVK